MKKTPLLLSSCLILIASNSALAMDIRGERTSFYERNKPKPIGFNYTFIELSYLHSTIENGTAADVIVQSIDTKVSFAMTPNISASLALNGAGYTTANNTIVSATEILVGATYHYPITKTTDIYSSLNQISISFDEPNSSQSSSSSGLSISFGLRQRIDSDMEWGFSATSIKVEDESYIQGRLNFSYGSDQETQYIAGYENTNTDNKRSTFTIGVRFNYD